MTPPDEKTRVQEAEHVPLGRLVNATLNALKQAEQAEPNSEAQNQALAAYQDGVREMQVFTFNADIGPEIADLVGGAEVRAHLLHLKRGDLAPEIQTYLDAAKTRHDEAVAKLGKTRNIAGARTLGLGVPSEGVPAYDEQRLIKHYYGATKLLEESSVSAAGGLKGALGDHRQVSKLLYETPYFGADGHEEERFAMGALTNPIEEFVDERDGISYDMHVIDIGEGEYRVLPRLTQSQRASAFLAMNPVGESTIFGGLVSDARQAAREKLSQLMTAGGKYEHVSHFTPYGNLIDAIVGDPTDPYSKRVDLDVFGGVHFEYVPRLTGEFEVDLHLIQTNPLIVRALLEGIPFEDAQRKEWTELSESEDGFITKTPGVGAVVNREILGMTLNLENFAAGTETALMLADIDLALGVGKLPLTGAKWALAGLRKSRQLQRMGKLAKASRPLAAAAKKLNLGAPGGGLPGRLMGMTAPILKSSRVTKGLKATAGTARSTYHMAFYEGLKSVIDGEKPIGEAVAEGASIGFFAGVMGKAARISRGLTGRAWRAVGGHAVFSAGRSGAYGKLNKWFAKEIPNPALRLSRDKLVLAASKSMSTATGERFVQAIDAGFVGQAFHAREEAMAWAQENGVPYEVTNPDIQAAFLQSFLDPDFGPSTMVFMASGFFGPELKRTMHPFEARKERVLRDPNTGRVLDSMGEGVERAREQLKTHLELFKGELDEAVKADPAQFLELANELAKDPKFDKSVRALLHEMKGTVPSAGHPHDVSLFGVEHLLRERSRAGPGWVQVFLEDVKTSGLHTLMSQARSRPMASEQGPAQPFPATMPTVSKMEAAPIREAVKAELARRRRVVTERVDEGRAKDRGEAWQQLEEEAAQRAEARRGKVVRAIETAAKKSENLAGLDEATLTELGYTEPTLAGQMKHALNSVNKHLGRKYKKTSEVPVEDVIAVSRAKREAEIQTGLNRVEEAEQAEQQAAIAEAKEANVPDAQMVEKGVAEVWDALKLHPDYAAKGGEKTALEWLREEDYATREAFEARVAEAKALGAGATLPEKVLKDGGKGAPLEPEVDEAALEAKRQAYLESVAKMAAETLPEQYGEGERLAFMKGLELLRRQPSGPGAPERGASWVLETINAVFHGGGGPLRTEALAHGMLYRLGGDPRYFDVVSALSGVSPERLRQIRRGMVAKGRSMLEPHLDHLKRLKTTDGKPYLRVGDLKKGKPVEEALSLILSMSPKDYAEATGQLPPTGKPQFPRAIARNWEGAIERLDSLFNAPQPIRAMVRSFMTAQLPAIQEAVGKKRDYHSLTARVAQGISSSVHGNTRGLNKAIEGQPAGLDTPMKLAESIVEQVLYGPENYVAPTKPSKGAGGKQARGGAKAEAPVEALSEANVAGAGRPSDSLDAVEDPRYALRTVAAAIREVIEVGQPGEMAISDLIDTRGGAPKSLYNREVPPDEPGNAQTLDAIVRGDPVIREALVEAYNPRPGEAPSTEAIQRADATLEGWQKTIGAAREFFANWIVDAAAKGGWGPRATDLVTAIRAKKLGQAVPEDVLDRLRDVPRTVQKVEGVEEVAPWVEADFKEALVREFQKREGVELDADNVLLYSFLDPVWLLLGGRTPRVMANRLHGLGRAVTKAQKYTTLGGWRDYVHARLQEGNPTVGVKALNVLANAVGKLLDPFSNRLINTEDALTSSGLAKEKAKQARRAGTAVDAYAREFDLKAEVILGEINALGMSERETILFSRLLEQHVKRLGVTPAELSKLMGISPEFARRVLPLMHSIQEHFAELGEHGVRTGSLSRRQLEAHKGAFIPRIKKSKEMSQLIKTLRRGESGQGGSWSYITSELMRTMDPNVNLLDFELNPNVYLPVGSRMEYIRNATLQRFSEFVSGKGAITREEWSQLPSSMQREFVRLAVPPEEIPKREGETLWDWHKRLRHLTSEPASMTAGRFVSEVARGMERKDTPFDSKAKQRKAAWTLPKEEIITKAPDLYVPRDTVRNMEITLTLADPGYSMTDASQRLRDLAYLWRETKTAFNPSFHVRNIWGSVVSNDMLGGATMYSFLRGMTLGQGPYAESGRDLGNWHDWALGHADFKGWGSRNRKLLAGHPMEAGILKMEAIVSRLGGSTYMATMLTDPSWRDYFEAGMKKESPYGMEDTSPERDVRSVIRWAEKTDAYRRDLHTRVARLMGSKDPDLAAEGMRKMVAFTGMTELWFKAANTYALLESSPGALFEDVVDAGAAGTAHYGKTTAWTTTWGAMFNPLATSEAVSKSRQGMVKALEKEGASPWQAMGPRSLVWGRSPMFNAAAKASVQHAFLPYHMQMVPAYSSALVRSPLRVTRNLLTTNLMWRTVAAAMSGGLVSRQLMLEGRGEDEEVNLPTEAEDAVDPRFADIFNNKWSMDPLLSLHGTDPTGTYDDLRKDVSGALKEALRGSALSWNMVIGMKGAQVQTANVEEVMRPLDYPVKFANLLGDLLAERMPGYRRKEGSYLELLTGFMGKGVIGAASSALEIGLGAEGKTRKQSVVEAGVDLSDEFFSFLNPATAIFSPEARRLVEAVALSGNRVVDMARGLYDPALGRDPFGKRVAGAVTSEFIPTRTGSYGSRLPEDVSSLGLAETLSSMIGSRPSQDDRVASNEVVRRTIKDQGGKLARWVYHYTSFGDGQGFGVDPAFFGAFAISQDIVVGSDGRSRLKSKPTTLIGELGRRLVKAGHNEEQVVEELQSYIKDVTRTTEDGSAPAELLFRAARRQAMDPDLFLRIWDAALGPKPTERILTMMHEDIVKNKNYKNAAVWHEVWEEANDQHPNGLTEDLKGYDSLINDLRVKWDGDLSGTGPVTGERPYSKAFKSQLPELMPGRFLEEREERREAKLFQELR